MEFIFFLLVLGCGEEEVRGKSPALRGDAAASGSNRNSTFTEFLLLRRTSGEPVSPRKFCLGKAAFG